MAKAGFSLASSYLLSLSSRKYLVDAKLNFTEFFSDRLHNRFSLAGCRQDGRSNIADFSCSCGCVFRRWLSDLTVFFSGRPLLIVFDLFWSSWSTYISIMYASENMEISVRLTGVNIATANFKSTVTDRRENARLQRDTQHRRHCGGTLF